jgi:flagellar biogenesis protein FliO
MRLLRRLTRAVNQAWGGARRREKAVQRPLHRGFWRCFARPWSTEGSLSSYGSYVVETVLTLLAVSLLAFVLLYGARRIGVGRATGGLDLVGRLPIDARRSVVLVRVAKLVFVVGVSEAGLTKLGEMSADDLPPQPVGPKEPFAALLRGAVGGARDGKAGDA